MGVPKGLQQTCQWLTLCASPDEGPALRDMRVRAQEQLTPEQLAQCQEWVAASGPGRKPLSTKPSCSESSQQTFSELKAGQAQPQARTPSQARESASKVGQVCNLSSLHSASLLHSIPLKNRLQTCSTLCSASPPPISKSPVQNCPLLVTANREQVT